MQAAKGVWPRLDAGRIQARNQSGVFRRGQTLLEYRQNLRPIAADQV
jgi:hypothetical protein